ncbi:hypothetical protein [Sphingomonas abaci]|uniref:DUF3325 domain-containing protein n=1 Tax=Sphingomonas abaci TaxID=237611 RepID=A0A7W7AMB6_9SPHN|nr:hypothetical protein [Sphingomonas abaci]MBB4619703.1 hypothetical protein [Sphingomonas abaci]
MLESVLTCLIGWLLLAAASFRIRRDLGLTAGEARWLRVAGVVVLTATLWRCGAPISGERWVRFLGAAGVSGVATVLILSAAPRPRLRRR